MTGTNNLKAHGGKRTGAGRPRLPAEKRTRPTTIRLTDAQTAWCEQQGGVSKVARELIDRAMNEKH